MGQARDLQGTGERQEQLTPPSSSLHYYFPLASIRYVAGVVVLFFKTFYGASMGPRRRKRPSPVPCFLCALLLCAKCEWRGLAHASIEGIRRMRTMISAIVWCTEHVVGSFQMWDVECTRKEFGSQKRQGSQHAHAPRRGRDAHRGL